MAEKILFQIFIEEEEEIHEDKENMKYNDEINVHAYFVDIPKLQHDKFGIH